jgi:hypothetical protein
MHRLILLIYIEFDYVKITYIGVFLKFVCTRTFDLFHSVCTFCMYSYVRLRF